MSSGDPSQVDSQTLGRSILRDLDEVKSRLYTIARPTTDPRSVAGTAWDAVGWLHEAMATIAEQQRRLDLYESPMGWARLQSRACNEVQGRDSRPPHHKGDRHEAS